MQVSEYAIKATNSFALPDICLRVRKMLDDDNSAIEDIANVVSLDPSMASKLLKLANSPLFRFRSQVDSLTKAVNVIGGEALYNLVMAETASTAFQHFANGGIDLKRFWRQSIYAGLVAKHMAKLCRIRGSERFFLLGLLHNLGELVVTTENPELASQCQAFDQQNSPWKLQQQGLGFTYADCSAEILKLWRLPTQLHFPIESLHNEDKAVTNKEIGIMHTAVRVAAALVNEGVYSPKELVNSVVLESTGLNEELLDDALNYANMEANKVLAIMHPGNN